MSDSSPTPLLDGAGPASSWVQRWSHLVPPRGSVLDIACGQGRHMQWFAQQGHVVTGIDRSPAALAVAASFGAVVLADIEMAPWPLMNGSQVRQFDAVVVTHYLWRPLLPLIAQCLAPGGLLIYETFSSGNETVGKPSRPDFLLRPGELLTAFASLRTIAFEEGFIENPPRFLQRIAAVRGASQAPGDQPPARYRL